MHLKIINKNSYFILSLFLSLFFSLFCSNPECDLQANNILNKKADLVIFSFDRPMQLYALLESVYHYINGLDQIYVIYRTTDEDYACAYDEVKCAFWDVRFIQQGDNPHQDFKQLTLQSIFESSNDYVLFAVDDIIVKNYINIYECTHAMETTGAYGFFLRLGKNITAIYSRNWLQRVPPCNEVAPGIYSWCFSNGKYEWCYPHSLDMTLYAKKEIEGDLRTMDYVAPNSLEGCWSKALGNVIHRNGLFYGYSKVINIPLNCVQQEYKESRNMGFMRSRELLEVFNRNLKIDIKPFFRIRNNAPHMEFEPTFIER